MICSTCGEKITKNVFWDKRYDFTCCSAICLLTQLTDFHITAVEIYEKRFGE